MTAPAGDGPRTDTAERLYRRLASQHRQRQRCAKLPDRGERIAELWADTDELLDRLLELRGKA